MTTILSNRRPGHTSEIKTNYKSAYVGALEPIMAELTEGTTGDASSSSTVAVSSGVNIFGIFERILATFDSENMVATYIFKYK